MEQLQEISDFFPLLASTLNLSYFKYPFIKKKCNTSQPLQDKKHARISMSLLMSEFKHTYYTIRKYDSRGTNRKIPRSLHILENQQTTNS